MKIMEFIYRKESNMENENNFSLNLSRDNHLNFFNRDEYVVSGLELIPTEVHLTK